MANQRTTAVGADATAKRSFGADMTALWDRVMELFPVRVWDRFARRNGLILAAGTSDQALFAVFAALYATFAVLGVWIGTQPEVIDSLMHGVNGLVPGLIRFSSSDLGIIDADEIRKVATGSTTLLSIAGVIAIVAVLWTAVGWITFLRSAVRDMFDLPPAEIHFAIMKVVDFLAALLFALLLFVGAGLSTVALSALGIVFDLTGLSDQSVGAVVATRLVSLLVAFAVDVILLVSLYRFLAGTDLSVRRVLPGALVGGAGLVLLQLLAAFVIGRAQINPLVATLTVLLGMLLWFRLLMMVILLGAAWVAESAEDDDVAVVAWKEYERRVEEARARADDATTRVREAIAAKSVAPWWRARGARMLLARAENDLTAAEAQLAAEEAALETLRRRGLRRSRLPEDTLTPPSGISSVSEVATPTRDVGRRG